MNHILEKYKNELSDYKIVDDNNILDLPKYCHIIYFSKKYLHKKSGMLKDIKDSSIVELCMNRVNRKWFIHRNENYIFYRPKCSKLRNSLQNLLNSDFKVTKKKDDQLNNTIEIMYTKDNSYSKKSYLELNSKINLDEISKNIKDLNKYYSL